MKVFKNTRNPILPWNEHMPDPEAHVMPDGNLYIYGSYDDNKDTYCSEKYHVVSTPDMENWTIHDIAFEGKNGNRYSCIISPKILPFSLGQGLYEIESDYEEYCKDKLIYGESHNFNNDNNEHSINGDGEDLDNAN